MAMAANNWIQIPSWSDLKPKTGKVVATVDGNPVYLSEVKELVSQIPQLSELPFEAIYPQLVKDVVSEKVSYIVRDHDKNLFESSLNKLRALEVEMKHKYGAKGYRSVTEDFAPWQIALQKKPKNRKDCKTAEIIGEFRSNSLLLLCILLNKCAICTKRVE